MSSADKYQGKKETEPKAVTEAEREGEVLKQIDDMQEKDGMEGTFHSKAFALKFREMMKEHKVEEFLLMADDKDGILCHVEMSIPCVIKGISQITRRMNISPEDLAGMIEAWRTVEKIGNLFQRKRDEKAK